MTNPTRLVQPWDTRPYQRFASVRYSDGQLDACFEDGACVGVAAQRLLRPGERTPDWDRLAFTPHEIVVPSDGDPIEISWLSIRLLTDPAFEAHWEAMAAEEDRFIGDRIATWRCEQGLSIEELARRAELPPETVASVEAGRTRAGFSLPERILTPLGVTLDDLAADPEPSSGPTPAAHSTTST